MLKVIFKNSKPKSKLTRLCLRSLAVLFGTVVVISVVVAITLVVTQKPVDLSQTEQISSALEYRNFSSLSRLPAPNYKRLNLTGLFNGEAREQLRPVIRWLQNDDLLIADGQSYSLSEASKGFVTKRSLFTPSAKEAISNYNGDTIFSSDTRYLAISKSTFKSFRYSTFGAYEILEISNGTVSSKYEIINNETYLQHFVWNPNYGSKDYVVASKNNLYYSSMPNGDNLVPITDDGNQYIYNGVADWLYEEEIFGSSSTIWWSPSGNRIAYVSFNDTKVDSAGISHHFSESPTPFYDEYPYPNTGTKNNPIAELWIWDKQSRQKFHVEKPQQLKQSNTKCKFCTPTFLSFSNPQITNAIAFFCSDSYLFAVQWISSRAKQHEILLSVWANRAQNEVFINMCTLSENFQSIRSITRQVPFNINGQKMWAEPQDFQSTANSDQSLFMLLPRKYGANIYTHISRISIQNLTIQSYSGGLYDIDAIVGYSKAKDEIYFLSGGGRIGQQHLYRLPNISTSPNNQPICVSCDQQNCARVKAFFSPTTNYFILSCHSAYSGFSLSLWETQNMSIKGNLWNSSPDHFKFELPKVEFETLATQTGIDAYVQLIFPPRFNPQRSYPVLLYIYNGPNSITVKDETPWELLTYLANARQYVIVITDASGTATRGWNIKQRIYKNLGTLEVDDQIDVLKQLLDKYSFMDRSRVASFGWSYGGFVNLHIAGRDGGKTVKCITTVAPVVSFLYYDSAYSERYMGLVNENREAYEKSSLVAPYVSEKYTDNFRNVTILLAHGLADDNVHYHNSALLASNLQSQLISFKQLVSRYNLPLFSLYFKVYTNEGHSLHNTIHHLFSEVDKFLLHDCFNLADI
uniref:Dipeptidyl peptidase 4 n=1 Tax=Syphacia muris TaxID=451379 RepID=A0A0N5AIH5_9BILA